MTEQKILTPEEVEEEMKIDLGWYLRQDHDNHRRIVQIVLAQTGGLRQEQECGIAGRFTMEAYDLLAACRGENSRLRATLRAAEQERDALKEEKETLILQLAGCGVAAMQNTETTIKDRITSDNPYYSASYSDVCRAVDREMALRSRVEELEKAIGNRWYVQTEDGEKCFYCGEDVLDEDENFCPKHPEPSDCIVLTIQKGEGEKK